MAILRFLTNAFPLWIIVCAILALAHPPLFTWFNKTLITYGLGVIMLGMGLTLSVEDFRRVLRAPFAIFLGVILQYTVMPLAGWGLGYVFELPTPLAVGLVLVASCPGGTASNVITFLAKGSVPLSVSMTTLSTLLAVGLTPLLSTVFVGNRMAVDTVGLLLSTVKVVLLPVGLGLLLNRYFPRLSKKLLPVSPLVAVIVIVLIVSSIVGGSKAMILTSGLTLLAAVFMLHGLGFLLGYGVSRVIVKDKLVSRTISIEVGMQNSGLGVVLAKSHFANPLIAVPSAISSVIHSLIGSVVAAIWRKRGCHAGKRESSEELK